MAAELASLGDDDFLLSTRPKWVRQGSLIVAGAENSPRGAVFGVFDLLRRMGCRFLAFDQSIDEELPREPPSGFPLGPPAQGNGLDLVVRPSFPLRDAIQWPAIGSSTHQLFAAKLGFNGK